MINKKQKHKPKPGTDYIVTHVTFETFLEVQRVNSSRWFAEMPLLNVYKKKSYGNYKTLKEGGRNPRKNSKLYYQNLLQPAKTVSQQPSGQNLYKENKYSML